MLKKCLLVLTMLIAMVGVIAVIILSIKLLSDEYERKEDEKRSEYFRQEEASREEEKKRAAANDLAAARERGLVFVSLEDVSAACPKVSQTHMELLKALGAFGEMPETSQMSLF